MTLTCFRKQASSICEEEGGIISGAPTQGPCHTLPPLTREPGTYITEQGMSLPWRSVRLMWLFLPLHILLCSSDKIRQLMPLKSHQQLTSAAGTGSSNTALWSNTPPAASLPSMYSLLSFLNEQIFSGGNYFHFKFIGTLWLQLWNHRGLWPWVLIIYHVALSQLPWTADFPFTLYLILFGKNNATHLTDTHLWLIAFILK